MKKNFYLLLMGIFVVLLIYSCQKKESPVALKPTDIPTEDIQKIKSLGFNTNGVKSDGDGYLVEGDIFISKKALSNSSQSTSVVIAKVEQYRTFNLIQSLPRTITISLTGFSGNFNTATDAAIARWNALKLTVRFQRVSSNGNIDIHSTYQLPDPDGSVLLGKGGFPENGNPYNTILLNTYVYNSGSDIGYLTSVIQHEIGHCIGLRHTDYFNRAYSCLTVRPDNVEGNDYNSSNPQNQSGAILIPGTPSTEDAGSIMLACNNGEDRNFNANDIIALGYLYPDNYAFANVATSRAYTKSNCAVSTAGTSVTYNVPAGRFTSYSQADADKKAENDLVTNGPLYANSNGGCNYPNNWKIDQWVLSSMAQGNQLNITLTRPQPDASQVAHIYFVIQRTGQPDITPPSITAPAGSSTYYTTVNLSSPLTGSYKLVMNYVY